MANQMEHTALLVMDVQPIIVGRLSNKDEYLAKVAATVAAAHQRHILVVYVVVGFRRVFRKSAPATRRFNPYVNLRRQTWWTRIRRWSLPQRTWWS